MRDPSSGWAVSLNWIRMVCLDAMKAEYSLEVLETAEKEDLLALIPVVSRLIKRCGTDNWWIDPEVFEAFEREGFHITQNTFYSPLPDIRQLDDRCFTTPYASAMPEFDGTGIWNEISSFVRELGDVPQNSASGFYWQNPFFPAFDVIVYYGLIRKFRPARIIEIGSGFSTHIAIRAMRQNQFGKLIAIEPYPSEILRQLAPELTLLEKRVQEVSLESFDELRAGDILFVDSSHVSKIDSDVNYVIFQILPRLAKGVLVHFHDIFLPDEYPREWVVGRNWFWNEQYLLLAFLMFNCQFETVMANAAFLKSNLETVRKTIPEFADHGGSFWIRRT